jgi:hypothetical protein
LNQSNWDKQTGGLNQTALVTCTWFDSYFRWNCWIGVDICCHSFCSITPILFPIYRLFNVVVAWYLLRTVKLLFCPCSLLVEKQNKSYLLMVHYFCCTGITDKQLQFLPKAIAVLIVHYFFVIYWLVIAGTGRYNTCYLMICSSF